jgi:hypothetical protein
MWKIRITKRTQERKKKKTDFPNAEENEQEKEEEEHGTKVSRRKKTANQRVFGCKNLHIFCYIQISLPRSQFFFFVQFANERKKACAANKHE